MLLVYLISIGSMTVFVDDISDPRLNPRNRTGVITGGGDINGHIVVAQKDELCVDVTINGECDKNVGIGQNKKIDEIDTYKNNNMKFDNEYSKNDVNIIKSKNYNSRIDNNELRNEPVKKDENIIKSKKANSSVGNNELRNEPVKNVKYIIKSKKADSREDNKELRNEHLKKDENIIQSKNYNHIVNNVGPENIYAKKMGDVVQSKIELKKCSKKNLNGNCIEYLEDGYTNNEKTIKKSVGIDEDRINEKYMELIEDYIKASKHQTSVPKNKEVLSRKTKKPINTAYLKESNNIQSKTRDYNNSLKTKDESVLKKENINLNGAKNSKYNELPFKSNELASRNRGNGTGLNASSPEDKIFYLSRKNEGKKLIPLTTDQRLSYKTDKTCKDDIVSDKNNSTFVKGNYLIEDSPNKNYTSDPIVNNNPTQKKKKLQKELILEISKFIDGLKESDNKNISGNTNINIKNSVFVAGNMNENGLDDVMQKDVNYDIPELINSTDTAEIKKPINIVVTQTSNVDRSGQTNMNLKDTEINTNTVNDPTSFTSLEKDISGTENDNQLSISKPVIKIEKNENIVDKECIETIDNRNCKKQNNLLNSISNENTKEAGVKKDFNIANPSSLNIQEDKKRTEIDNKDCVKSKTTDTDIVLKLDNNGQNISELNKISLPLNFNISIINRKNNGDSVNCTESRNNIDKDESRIEECINIKKGYKNLIKNSDKNERVVTVNLNDFDKEKKLETNIKKINDVVKLSDSTDKKERDNSIIGGGKNVKVDLIGNNRIGLKNTASKNNHEKQFQLINSSDKVLEDRDTINFKISPNQIENNENKNEAEMINIQNNKNPNIQISFEKVEIDKPYQMNFKDKGSNIENDGKNVEIEIKRPNSDNIRLQYKENPDLNIQPLSNEEQLLNGLRMVNNARSEVINNNLERSTNHINKLEEEITKIDSQIKKLVGNITNTKKKKAEIQQVSLINKNGIKNLKDADEANKKELKKINAEARILSNEINSLRRELDAKKINLDEISGRIELRTGRSKNIVNEIDNKNNEDTDCDKKLKELKKAIEKYEEILIDLNNEKNDLLKEKKLEIDKKRRFEKQKNKILKCLNTEEETEW